MRFDAGIKFGVAGGVACLVLAFISLILVVLAPVDIVMTVFPIIAMGLFILGGLCLSIALFWLPLIEVLTSKNETNWKIIWILVLFFLSGLGGIIYYFVARKELKG